MAPVAKEIFTCFDKAFARGAKIMNPESQYTGMLTIDPIILKARGTFFFPTSLRVPSASVNAPPDFSRNLPIIEPARIIIPMIPIVFPKPEFMDFTTSSNDKVPDNPPYPKAAIKSEKTGCHLSFEVVKIMKAIEINKRMINHISE